MKKYYFGVSVRKKKRENIKLLIPLFLTEPKTGRTRYPTCTKTILGPSLFCAQPVRQMVHGNDPLQSPAHSNRLRCLHTHTQTPVANQWSLPSRTLRIWQRDPPIGSVAGRWYPSHPHAQCGVLSWLEHLDLMVPYGYSLSRSLK